MSPTHLALITLLVPLASAAIIALFLRRSGTLAQIISVTACAAYAAAALMLAFGGSRQLLKTTLPGYRDEAVNASFDWLSIGDFTLSLGIKFDDLAALMLVIVAIVGLCVHIFSIGYMRDDKARARYFGGLSIFMFSMTGIVLADNLFMMFIFWELVGFSSWLLINHYREKQFAADASKKAFIVNRVGDFGFLLGIIACYYVFGTTNLTEMSAKIAGGAAVATCIPLALFCGAVGKSAQFPLHVWLPDAMEGPTPVSALIHAATMVAAGIYMLCRIEPIFAAVPAALNVVMWAGVITALYAALCAITQSDIKKVLAYSTLSQLGYMVAAFGLGNIVKDVGMQPSGNGEMAPLFLIFGTGAAAAMFHLTTHAFFKALLFLGSGSVIAGCHHEQNIFKMGGLRRKMPITFITFTIGVLAIIGMPFLSGFFSKDSILYLAMHNNMAAFSILTLTAVLTAFYMVRMWKITFLGQSRSEEASHAKESSISMTTPLIVLALLAVGFVYVPVFYKAFLGVFDNVPLAQGTAHTIILITSIAVMLIGAGAALAFYKSAATDTLRDRIPGVFTILTHLKETPDRVYNYYVTKLQQRFALLLNFLDQFLIGGLIVRGLAGLTGFFGLGARALHVGSIHAYVYWFFIGVVLIWAFATGFLS
ncbi:NADH-quinone oxidoreductase subunit L [Ereboglobus sp. PH5-10]|uniref:NADH-quinone oxidoreductase subunit 5 family protein n=1 Tax=Ereboglobus sp. PH5-10 TaxID=2940629 RepID=UPI002405D30D|nr:proton-conducting transporter membrane subunit [Ereboglobus sp. PH5-10]MDF9825943.1 NADH-quinone oxidoreductase subunit L [Ereboglobus sp. PH5-10]